MKAPITKTLNDLPTSVATELKSQRALSLEQVRLVASQLLISLEIESLKVSEVTTARHPVFCIEGFCNKQGLRQTYFLKQLAANDSSNELKLNQLAIDKSRLTVPNVVGLVPNHLLVMTALPARDAFCDNFTTSDNEQLAADSWLPTVMQGLAAFHSQPAWPELPRLTIEDIAPNKAQSIEVQVKKSLLEMLTDVQACIFPKRSQMLEAGPYDGLLHGDLVRENVFVYVRNQLLGLIDFEYCCLGDVRWDLAAFIVEHNVDTAVALKCFEKYAELRGFEVAEFTKHATDWVLFYWAVAADWSIQNDYSLEQYEAYLPVIQNMCDA